LSSNHRAIAGVAPDGVALRTDCESACMARGLAGGARVAKRRAAIRAAQIPKATCEGRLVLRFGWPLGSTEVQLVAMRAMPEIETLAPQEADFPGEVFGSWQQSDDLPGAVEGATA
jgi:hypothetical protein